MHIDESVLDENQTIDQTKIDLVGRMGGDYYVRANGDALFTVPKPIRNLGIGVDQIPDKIKNESIFSGNDLGMLGNIEAIPSSEDAKAFKNELGIENDWSSQLTKAKELLAEEKIEEAWKVLID